nr:sel1 repeat family protein [Treponema sp.]
MKILLSGAAALLAGVFLISSCASTKNTVEKPVSSIVSKEELAEIFKLQFHSENLAEEELFSLGEKYENGEGVVQFYSMALLCYQKAKEAGSSDAENALAKLEAKKAEVLANSPDGQGELFNFYRSGITAGQGGNFEQSYAVMYDTAFFFGDNKGLEGLASQLLKGKGVEQDVDKAISVFEYLAEIEGSGKAWSALAQIYEAEDGTYPGVKQSMDKAIEYFYSSYQKENLKSPDFKGPRYIADYFDAGFTHDDGRWQEPDYVKAEDAYLLAANSSGKNFDGTACYKLALYYEEGRTGIAQNYEKAALYYQKAVSDSNTHSTMLGIPQTYYALGRFYENGLGLEKDVTKAKEYYQKALDAANETLALEFAS